VRLALDTNVLVYAEGANGAAMQELTLRLIDALRSGHTLYLPGQTIGELFNVLVRKARRTPADARAAVLTWLNPAPVIETSRAVISTALDIAADHQLSIWDAAIVAAAGDAECSLLLTEDLQDGFTWGGVTVVNPYAPSLHPLLAGLLAPNGRR
jgi:predicted nucleic acid-binding protein